MVSIIEDKMKELTQPIVTRTAGDMLQPHPVRMGIIENRRQLCQN